MRRLRLFAYGGAVVAMVYLLARLPEVHSASPAADPDVARVVDEVLQLRKKLSTADRQAALDLNHQGDQAYRRADYAAAFTAYANSYPNYPTAYAYIMAGDSHWRGVVASKKAAAANGNARCSLSNVHFTHDLQSDLSRHHKVGLALVEHDDDRRLAQSDLVRRAAKEAACLGNLAKIYANEPTDACVSIDKIENCLGKPLVK